MSGWIEEKYVLGKPNEYVEPEVGCHCTSADTCPDPLAHDSSEAKVPATGNMQTVDIDDFVAIPLEIQERLFELEFDNAHESLVHTLTEEHSTEIYNLALTRLRDGFRAYHSEMFTWDAETRRRNVMEELADAIVYLTSGPLA